MAASALQSLETKLDDIFGKQAPQLPDNGKQALVKYLPWINLILGIWALLGALALWRWAHVAEKAIDTLNRLSAAYGGEVVPNRMTFTIWLSLTIMTITALLYIAAFPGTRDRKKSGWNLMFYALLLNVVYGAVGLFTDYGGFGSFIGSLIGTAIGFYLIFQIRPAYSTKGVAAGSGSVAAKPAAPAAGEPATKATSAKKPAASARKKSGTRKK